MSSQRKQTYIIGQQVDTVAEQVFPFGVFVRLLDGSTGYIRRRELTWSGDIDPHDVVKIGQHLRAVIIKLDQTGSKMELSHKVTLPDPWPDFVRQHKVGSIITGTVKSLKSFGAFVEIVPGVDGLVPLEQLATWNIDRPEQVVWKSDDVAAVISRIDPEQRNVRLSIRERLLQVAQAHETLERLERRHGRSETEERNDGQTGSLQEQTQASLELDGEVLVVDDRDEVTGPLVEWLQSRGCQVRCAGDLTKARALLSAQHYAAILVDIDLDGEDGLDLLITERQALAETPVAVISTPDWLTERVRDIEALDVATVIPKPLDLLEIEEFLQNVASGQPLAPWQATKLYSSEAEQVPMADFIIAMENGASLEERLRASLELLAKATQSDAAILFHRDPASARISIQAQGGDADIHQEALYGLEHSPVGNVIQRNQTVFENQVPGRAEKRFEKLSGLLPFGSCIGVPVMVQEDTHHALFLFSKGQDAFHSYRVRDAQATALSLSATLERDLVARNIQQVNALVLHGQMAAGMGHDIYNALTGIEMRLNNLQNDCNTLQKNHPEVTQLSRYVDMKEEVDALTKSTSALRTTIGLFQQMMRPGQDNMVDVNNVLGHSAALMRSTAGRSHIKFQIERATNLPLTPGNPAALQQVFLNLMLNAIQHISAIKDQGGLLQIETVHDPKSERPVLIRFKDNGRGIHKELLERIFSLGFTTRSDGSGLGLYFARNLIESFGGTICVEKSIVPFETVFLIALPAAGLE